MPHRVVQREVAIRSVLIFALFQARLQVHGAIFQRQRQASPEITRKQIGIGKPAFIHRAIAGNLANQPVTGSCELQCKDRFFRISVFPGSLERSLPALLQPFITQKLPFQVELEAVEIRFERMLPQICDFIQTACALQFSGGLAQRDVARE
jgi:hypothetical protein